MGSEPKVVVGSVAPEFRLRSQSGEEVALADFRGKKSVVLFFYPKDNTPGCTAEACGFRDEYESFSEAGAEVIGISSDSTESHAGFAKRFKLPMTLLSDPQGHTAARYGVKATFGILKGRVTFVIDRDGVVKHVFDSQLRATKHVSEAMEIVKSLQR